MPHCTFCNKCCYFYSNYMQNSSLILFGDTSSEIRVRRYKFGDTSWEIQVRRYELGDTSSEIRGVRRYEEFGDTRSSEIRGVRNSEIRVSEIRGVRSSVIQVSEIRVSEIRVWRYEFGDMSSEIRVPRLKVRRKRHVSHKCNNGNIYYQKCSMV